VQEKMRGALNGWDKVLGAVWGCPKVCREKEQRWRRARTLIDPSIKSGGENNEPPGARLWLVEEIGDAQKDDADK
jgi:hypothetical protein